jgi:hypothetical protein
MSAFDVFATIILMGCAAGAAVIATNDQEPLVKKAPAAKAPQEVVQLEPVPPQAPQTVDGLRIGAIEKRVEAQEKKINDIDKKLDLLLTPKEKADAERR